MGQMKDIYMRMLQENPEHVNDFEYEFDFEAWYEQVRSNGVVAFGTNDLGEICMLHEYSVARLYEIAAQHQIKGELNLVFPTKIIHT